MYSGYTAASIAREYDLTDETGATLIGAVNWSFAFEDQPWIAGFRDLATNGVNKPVSNVFLMLGMMEGQRIAVGGKLAYVEKDGVAQESGCRPDRRTGAG